MKRTFFFLFISLLPGIILNSYAQSGFVPGSVTKTDGQTIYGLINKAQFSVSPDTLIFKAGNEAAESFYAPEQLLSFSMENIVYEPAKVFFHPNSRNRILENEDAYQPINTHIFVRVLVKGQKALYVHEAQGGIDYLFVKEGNTFTYLIQYDYKKQSDANNETIVAQNEGFKKQLFNLFSDNMSVAGKIRNTQYKSTGSNSITELFELYYKVALATKMETLKLTDSKKTGKITAEIKAGAVVQTLGMNFEYKRNRYIFDFTPDIKPLVYLTLGYSLPAVSKPVSLNLELTANTFNYEHEFVKMNYAHLPDSFAFNYAGLSYSLRAYVNIEWFSINKTRIYAIAGAGPNSTVANENKFWIKETTTFTTRETQKEMIEKSPGLILLGGMGANINNMLIEARYETTLPFFINFTTSERSRISRIVLVAGYKF